METNMMSSCTWALSCHVLAVLCTTLSLNLDHYFPYRSQWSEGSTVPQTVG